ncbi:MAG TPA: glycoside hydrolase family 15 protein [Gaiellaceae bacterium]|nr:glycoside hydrolase family 15 protein [Gaiellaceae bacterium]
MRAPQRTDGYAPIEDYAAIGDGRSLALVGLDGSIDWLCLPDLDSAAVFAALLDPERGGRFFLRPTGTFETERRYADDSNVLETVYATSSGVVKVTEGMLTDGGALLPWTEIVRRVECIEGEVELEWRVEARPFWGRETPRASMRENVALVEWDGDAIAILNYDCGTSKTAGPDVHGKFTIGRSSGALLAALYFDDTPYAVPPRGELEARLDRTLEYWQRYTREIPYDGPWRGAVRRSVLAQRLLTFPDTGAIAAAATTSLPERIGGDRNWDYRFSWVRDTSLALESLLAARLSVECERSLAWVLDASRRDGELQPMYTLRGEPDLPRENLELAGWRGSRPVRVGNDAESQLQMGTYADILDAAYRFCGAGHILDPRSAERCAEIADEVCRIWRRPDFGIWELDEHDWTESNIACWAALDHAVELAGEGRLPDGNVEEWKRERQAIRDWIEERCWSEERGAYVAYSGGDGLDASVLLGARFGYFEPGDERFASTIAAIRAELGTGPFLHRTTALKGEEGCFLACSFWLVDALARQGRIEEARELMEELLPASNDVGLYAEQIDPRSGAFLGNVPQALTHLSLILAAVSVMRGERSAV